MTESFSCPPLGSLNLTSWEPSLSHAVCFDVLSLSRCALPVNGFYCALLIAIPYFFFPSLVITLCFSGESQGASQSNTHKSFGLFKNQDIPSMSPVCLFHQNAPWVSERLSANKSTTLPQSRACLQPDRMWKQSFGIFCVRLSLLCYGGLWTIHLPLNLPLLKQFWCVFNFTF